MNKILFTLLVSFITLKSSLAQIAPILDYKLQHALDSVCNVYKIKGASAAVLLPNAGTWKGVHGIADNSLQPVTSDMLLGIGSNTKTYIATLLLKMQEDNLVDLDDTIGTWIPNQPNIKGYIKIRQLLNHTSGIYNYTSHPSFNSALNNDFSAIWQPEDILTQFINAPLFNPGANWSYSNSNYLIAGIIIKQILNQPLSTSLRNNILQPQGLNNTFLFPDEQLTAPMANIWTINFMQPYLEDIITEYGYSHNAMFSMANAAGGIVATAADNVAFFDKLMSESIITGGSLEQMKTFRAISSTRAYGLGLFRTKNFNGRVVYGHGGTNIGYINENIFDSINGACISVLTNQDSVSNNIVLNKVVYELHRIILQNPLNTLAIAPKPHDVNVQVFPNPATDYLNISTKRTEALTVHFVNAMGQELITNKVNNGSCKINVSSFPKGIYMIYASDSFNKKEFVQKIVLE